MKVFRIAAFKLLIIPSSAIVIATALMCSAVQAAEPPLAKKRLGNVQVFIFKSRTQNTAAALNKNSKEIKSARLETAEVSVAGTTPKVVDFTVSVNYDSEGFVFNVGGAVNTGQLLDKSGFNTNFSRVPVYKILKFTATVPGGKSEPVARFIHVSQTAGFHAPNLTVVVK